MSKTARQFLTAVRSNLSELKGLRYVSSIATADGGSTGLTLIDTTLSTYANDHFVGCVAKIASDHRRPLISDFVSSTGTLTVGDGSTPSTGFGRQATIGVAYEIMEKGIWDDSELIQFGNESQIDLLNMLSDDALVTVAKGTTTAGTLGDSALPSDFIRLISLLISDSGSSSEFTVAGIIPPDEEWRFYHDPFLTGNSDNPVAIFRAGRVLYRPAVNATLKWSYIGKLLDLSGSQGFEWPDDFFPLICDRSTAKAFEVSEDYNSAAIFNRRFLEGVQARNLQVDDTALSKFAGSLRSDITRKAA